MATNGYGVNKKFARREGGPPGDAACTDSMALRNESNAYTEGHVVRNSIYVTDAGTRSLQMYIPRGVGLDDDGDEDNDYYLDGDSDEK